MVKELTPQARRILMTEHWAYINQMQSQNLHRKYPKINESKNLPQLHVMSFNEFCKSKGF
jgi:hypothetical protein